MTEYEKLPVRVHAVKWTGQNTIDIADLLGRADHAVLWCIRRETHKLHVLQVTTVDGNPVTVPVGAYLVLDSKNYPYPCDAEIFEAGHVEVVTPLMDLTKLFPKAKPTAPRIDLRPTQSPPPPPFGSPPQYWLGAGTEHTCPLTEAKPGEVMMYACPVCSGATW